MSKENGNIVGPKSGEILLNSEVLHTKIAAVREQLQSNPNVYFAGEIHQFHPEAPEYGYWTETVSIIVAPKNPQFDAEKLNLFMNGIILDIEPSATDKAWGRGDGGIELGKLYFDETIGTISKTTSITIESFETEIMERVKKPLGVSQEKWSREIQRRTWVRVYPDPASANNIYEYEIGIENGTVLPEVALEYAQHWLDKDQVRQLKAQHTKSPASFVKRLHNKDK